ncbi:MAG: hypothetical protein HY293_10100, partial [Planctomycetes bacterium]|nr:hypothetical protein [Planctomycetota bacterium]
NNHVYVSSASNTYAVNLTTQSQVWTTNSGGWLGISDGRLYISHPGGAVTMRLLQ